LAGQPQEPTWRSAEQDQTRPAWQSPAAPSTDKDTYAYPQTTVDQGYGQSYPPPGQPYSQAYSEQEQPYAQPGQGYPGPSYTAPDAGYPGQGQGYQDQGYQGQGYPGPQGQSAPSWQAAAGMSSAAMNSKAAGHARGFLGSLFDFSFTSFVTPKIIKVLYVLITVWTVIWALIFLRLGFKYGGAAGGFFTLLIVDPVLVLLTLGVYRVVLELFMVVHRMHDDLKAIRDRGDDQG
jgi:uncharacterized membrane protein